MSGKIPFILGLGAGYLLGTRAGRAQYERIKATAVKIVEQPFVRTRVDAAFSGRRPPAPLRRRSSRSTTPR